MSTPRSQRVHALTVDVEEYFHPNAMDAVVPTDRWDQLPSRVEGNTRRLLDLLAAHAARATFFVLGWVGERFPHLVRDIGDAGHEIACHGHAHRLAYRLGRDRFRADVRRAKSVLEDITGAPVNGFRAASFSIVPSTPWAIDALVDAGFAYDASIFPIRHDLYGFPGFPRFPVRLRAAKGEIVEIPASTVRLLGRNWPVAGGGYLRLLPLALTRAAIDRISTRDGAPAIVYVHPWELDPEQPRLDGSPFTRFRQYANLRRTESRLGTLLGERSFAPLAEVIDFAGAPRYEPAWQGERP